MRSIAIWIVAVGWLEAVLCCQQILGLDDGKSTSGTGGAASASGSTSSGASTSGGASATSASTGSGSGGRAATSTSTASSAASTGGTGGATSSSAGTGGSVNCAALNMGPGGGCTLPVTLASLIDNMEGMSGCITPAPGRAGCWFTYNDGTDGGTQTPMAGGTCKPALITIPDGGRCGSHYAQNTFGSGFTNYGAGLGFDLNDPAGPRKPYDVSKYHGIVFWGLAPESSPAQPLSVDVQVLELATTPTTADGTCTTGCNDHYSLLISFTSEWTPFLVPFSCLAQQSFGTPVAWDPTSVLAVQFVVNPAPAFDFWIDDIGFY